MSLNLIIGGVPGEKKIGNYLLEQILPKRISKFWTLAVGVGNMLEKLSKLGRVWGIDISEEALNYCRKRGFGRVFQWDAQNIVFPATTFNLAIALDLLEHIPDDFKVIAECYRVLKSQGILLLTVPVYRFLWCQHDEALDHLRRYQRSGLKDKLSQAGFKIEKISYSIFFFSFPILILRLLQRYFYKSVLPNTTLILFPKWINTSLIFLLDIEKYLLRWIYFPFGVSILCSKKI